MHTLPSTDIAATAAATANQTDLSAGLFVLELEERLEMAALASKPGGCDRCDVDM